MIPRALLALALALAPIGMAFGAIPDAMPGDAMSGDASGDATGDSADDSADAIAGPWYWEAAGAAAAGAGWLGLHLAGPSLVETDCPCTPDMVNRFDRFAIEQRLTHGERLADGLLAAGLAGSLTLAAVSAPEGEAIGDGLLVLQSAAIAGLLTAGIKAAVGRPYPYMYGPAPYPEQNGDGVNYAAFPSGHTAVPMAAAVSAAWLFARRHPRSPWRWVVWTVGPALALAAGAAQVGAANHFPSDVIGGALLGAGVGLLDPWLHAR